MKKIRWEELVGIAISAWVGAKAALYYQDMLQAMIYSVIALTIAFISASLINMLLDRKRHVPVAGGPGWYVFMERQNHANIAFGPFKTAQKADHESTYSSFIGNYAEEDCLDMWTMWSDGTDIPKEWLRINYDYIKV